MGQTCSTHLLLCLDGDLERDATPTVYKDAVTKAKRDQNCKWLPRYGWTNAAAERMDFARGVIGSRLPVALDHESKLTIMCHASPTSFGNKDITPHSLAGLVQATVQGQKIKRVGRGRRQQDLPRLRRRSWGLCRVPVGQLGRQDRHDGDAPCRPCARCGSW
jgi:hypothetical protein